MYDPLPIHTNVLPPRGRTRLKYLSSGALPSQGRQPQASGFHRPTSEHRTPTFFVCHKCMAFLWWSTTTPRDPPAALSPSRFSGNPCSGICETPTKTSDHQPPGRNEKQHAPKTHLAQANSTPECYKFNPDSPGQAKLVQVMKRWPSIATEF